MSRVPSCDSQGEGACVELNLERKECLDDVKGPYRRGGCRDGEGGGEENECRMGMEKPRKGCKGGNV